MHKKNSKSFSYKTNLNALHGFSFGHITHHFPDGNDLRSKEWNNEDEGQTAKPKNLKSDRHDYPKTKWTVWVSNHTYVWPCCCEIDFISLHCEP